MALVFLQQKSCGGSSVIQKESTGKPGTGNPLLGTEPLLLNKLQERFFFFSFFPSPGDYWLPRSRILYHVCLILKSTFLLFSRITPDSLWQSGCGERLLDAGGAVAAGRVPGSRGGRRRRLLEAGRPAPG